MKILRFDAEKNEAEWDAFIGISNNGTFLQTRRFLNYHKDRFTDVSLIIRNDKEQIAGVFPAATNSTDPLLVSSHPGITHGGLICSGRTGAGDVHKILQLVFQWYKEQGYQSLLYKAIPFHLHTIPFHSDIHALWDLGARIERRDLWNVIHLDGSRSLSKGRKWAVNKALSSGLDIRTDGSGQAYSNFFEVLRECLNERHGALPAHTVDEMLELGSRFPEQIDLWTASDKNGCVAGAWIFKMSKSAWHTQYIASTEKGRSLFSVDLLLETIIKSAERHGIKYFSFGASTEREGKVLNTGLFNFKAGFGAGSAVQDFYVWS